MSANVIQGVTVERWNGRAVRGALIRLEQTGYLRRFTMEKKRWDPQLKSNHFICVQRLREPNENDLNNLKFKSIAGPSASGTIEEQPLEDEGTHDGFVHEMEQDLMNEGSDEDDDADSDRRIPPQWTPDRLLTNLVVDVVDAAGTDGTDAAKLRDFTTGFFWKRPIESLLTRLTDGWDKNQPLHVRHLAITRDTAMAVDKKRVHYMYRTHANFQKAVDAGELTWEALDLDEFKKGARAKKQQASGVTSSLDVWGFRALNPNDFQRRTGAATLAEACAAITISRRAPRDWESKLLNEDSNGQVSLTLEQEATSPTASNSPSVHQRRTHQSSKIPPPLLTQAERLALGLPAKGRLGADFESQIRAHRMKTGVANSIPAELFKGVKKDEPKPKPRYERRPGPPLLTREERKARGLPEHGRLSFKVTEQILREQGRNESLTHMKGFVEHADDKYGESKNAAGAELDEEQTSSIAAEVEIVEEHIDSNGNKEHGTPHTETRDNVLKPPNRSLNDTLAKTSAMPQPSDHAAERSALASEDGQQRKRPLVGGDGLAGRSKKRTKTSLEPYSDQDSPIGGLSIQRLLNPVQQQAQNGSVQTDTFIVPVQGSTSQASHNPGTLSSIPIDDHVSEIEDSDNTWQTKKTAGKGRRGPYKKRAKAVPQVPPTAAELRVQNTKALYEDRASNGLYINPYATKPAKGGRGRPRKLFIATFKLPGLHGLPWFVPDPDQEDVSAPFATAPSTIISDRRPLHSDMSLGAPPSLSAVEISVADVPMQSSSSPVVQLQSEDLEREPHGEAATALSPYSATVPHGDTEVPRRAALSALDPHRFKPGPSFTSINTSAPMESDKPSQATSTPSEAISDVLEPPNRYSEADKPSRDLDVTKALDRTATLPGSPITIDEVMTDVVERSSESQIPEVFIASTDTQQETYPLQENEDKRRYSLTSPLTRTSMLSALNHSSNAPTVSQGTPRDQTPIAPQEKTLGTGSIPHRTPSQGSASIADDNLSEVPTPMQILPKKKATKIGRGVVLGKGSVAHARSRIIRHILDLCHGVFPGTEVMYPVFSSVWDELGPKNIVCPIPGTIRRAIIDLCHPHSDLREVKFTVPRKDLPGNKTRSVFFYKHLEFNSPEVQSVVKGIIQSYPEKFCPPEVRQYWKEEVKSVPTMPKIDKSYYEDIYPPTSRKLDERIKEARKERRRLAKQALAEKRRLEKEAKREQKRLAKEQRRKEKLENSESRRKLFKERHRLVSLNDRLQIEEGTATQRPALKLIGQQASSLPTRAQLPSQKSGETPIGDLPHTHIANEDPLQTALNPEGGHAAFSSCPQRNLAGHTAALMAPEISQHLSTHTFATNFTFLVTSRAKEPTKKTRKRVRIDQPTGQPAQKKPRKSLTHSTSRSKHSADDFLARHHIEINEDLEDEDEDKEQEQHEDEITSPNIAQRLAGLTGDLNKPDYDPHEKRKYSSWTEPGDGRHRDPIKRKYTVVKERTYPETFDPLAEFRKLCFTLVIASSMAGEDENVNWDIVTKVYSEAPRFDLQKTQSMWAWMQKNMASQIRSMTGSFQSNFLSAYEEGRVDPIEDPINYKWDKLVRWALTACTYLEPPLPVAREALEDCQFDISSYDILDRTVWYNTSLANTNRSERLVKYAFGKPLHAYPKATTPGDEDDLKARSLIRANISTPGEFYDKTLAYNKLKTLPETVISRSVHDLLRASLIKQRKVKRTLPGRNYLFSHNFAKHYRRTLELSDFMSAVTLKKDLDRAFLNSDPSKRTYLVSRTAEDGTVMALISLASEGKIKLVPQLPPIKNEFNAPLPRISVWGFCEGDYKHRLMDRKRLFWPLEVLPTEAYEYGNPLRPTPAPPNPAEDFSIDWDPMPEPPLPARDQSDNALLPIWSTIDGKRVIYPWWNRILSIVIQALAFQPSITAQEIFDRCEKYTTEVFEIQLVLDWLVATKAAKCSRHGTYEAIPGFWAVFGDKLIDEENDEFGEHVRRLRTTKQLVPTWRTKYNNEYGRLQQAGGSSGPAEVDGVSPGQQILKNSRKQYSIVKKMLQNRAPPETVDSSPAATPAATPSTTTQDVDMTDADAEGEDIDAEGESDDEYL